MREKKNRIPYMIGMVMLLLLSVTVVAAATHEPLADPIPEPIEKGTLNIRLEPVVAGMTAPNWGTAVPGCQSLRGRLVVTDQPGILWAVNLATSEKRVLLDVSDRLVALGVGGPGTFDERGLLGVAFHPDFAANGLLYTYTSEPVAGSADFSTMPEGVDANHQSVVNEWQIPEPCNPDSVVDPGSVREILRIDEPQFNHDAGALTFGPDGKLYVALGDGGAADDQGVGHVPGGNGQAPDNILGTIIRINPQGSNATNGQYGVPADNPFVDEAGFLDEVFAYGFRNPFRISFDTMTGDLYAADVGQNDIEEIDLVTAGGNYGWREKEGSFCFDPNGAEAGFVFECAPDDAPEGLIDPIAEYDHDEGIAVVGGFVYRGERIPALRGHYLFGDFFHPPSGSGRLFFLQQNNRILEFQYAEQETLGLPLLGFGQDANGEVYVLANATGTPFGDTGVVLRIAPADRRPARSFRTHLSGAEQVPPVETNAQGQANIQFSEDFTELNYKLIASNIDDVFAAHIHCAPDGINGPVGITLWSGDPISPNGILAQDTLTVPDEDNGCNWTTLTDVATAIENGYAYVNVHTEAHPAGEIRGQLH